MKFDIFNERTWQPEAVSVEIAMIGTETNDLILIIPNEDAFSNKECIKALIAI